MAEKTKTELETLERKISVENRGVIATADFVDPEELYKELITRVQKYHPNTDNTK